MRTVAQADYKFDGTARDNTTSVRTKGNSLLKTTADNFIKTGAERSLKHWSVTDDIRTVDLDETAAVAGGVRVGDSLNNVRTGELQQNGTYDYLSPGSSQRSTTYSRRQLSGRETGTFAHSTEKISGSGNYYVRNAVTQNGVAQPATYSPESHPWDLTGDKEKVIYRENALVVREETPPEWYESGYSATWDYVRVIGGGVEFLFGLGTTLFVGPATAGTYIPFGVLTMGMGIDDIITGVKNIRTGQPAPSTWDFAWQSMTGSQWAGPIAGLAVGFGPWGLSRIWQTGRFAGGVHRLSVAEEITGIQAALITRGLRNDYRRIYAEAIKALREAGRAGITADQLMEHVTGLRTLLNGSSDILSAIRAGDKFANSFWETIGRISGAMTSRWSAREVGAWVVLNQDKIGLSVIINMGPKAYVPGLGLWLAKRIPNLFERVNGQPSLASLIFQPRLFEPRAAGEMIAHLGHTHPYLGDLKATETDLNVVITYYKKNFKQSRSGVGTARQDKGIVLSGATGQWHWDDLDHFLSLLPAP